MDRIMAYIKREAPTLLLGVAIMAIIFICVKARAESVDVKFKWDPVPTAEKYRIRKSVDLKTWDIVWEGPETEVVLSISEEVPMVLKACAIRGPMESCNNRAGVWYYYGWDLDTPKALSGCECIPCPPPTPTPTE